MLELTSSEADERSVISKKQTTFTARVTGGAGHRVRFVKNGVPMEPAAITADPFTVELVAVAPETGEDRYRAEVLVDDHPRTVASNYFLRAEDGCSCTAQAAAGRSTAWVLLFFACLWSLRR